MSWITGKVGTARPVKWGIPEKCKADRNKLVSKSKRLENSEIPKKWYKWPLKKSHTSRNSIFFFLAEPINSHKIRECNRDWMKMQIMKAEEMRQSESLTLMFVLGHSHQGMDSFHPTIFTWHMSPLAQPHTCAVRGAWVSDLQSLCCLGNTLSGVIFFKCVTSTEKYRMKCQYLEIGS